MDDQELIKKLLELENEQWVNGALTEIRSQLTEYEYKIVFESEEEGFFGAIKESTLAGYTILPNTAHFQNKVFLVLMKREKAK
jgi:hypothetical protein